MFPYERNMVGDHPCFQGRTSELITINSLHVQQWLGAPLYWCNQGWSYCWQAVVKESTALLLLSLNQWRTPMIAQVSSDSSIQGQIRKTPGRKIIFDFPDRIVLIANHQVSDSYTISVVLYVGIVVDIYRYTQIGSLSGGRLILLVIMVIFLSFLKILSKEFQFSALV